MLRRPISPSEGPTVTGVLMAYVVCLMLFLAGPVWFAVTFGPSVLDDESPSGFWPVFFVLAAAEGILIALAVRLSSDRRHGDGR